MDFIKNIIDTLSDVRILFTLLTVIFPFIFPPMTGLKQKIESGEFINSGLIRVASVFL